MAAVSRTLSPAAAPAPRTRGRIRAADWLLGGVSACAFLALYVPILVVFVLSFFPTRRGAVQWDRFTLDWYGDLFANAEIGEALGWTLLVGFVSVLAATTLATGLALYAEAPRRGRHERAGLEILVLLPFLLPPIITGLALLIFFRELGLSRGLGTVMVGHTVFVLALVYRTVLNRLQSIGPSLVEASRDLGASRWFTFRHVVLPQLKSAIGVSALLAFALSFDETMITLFLVGDESTLPIRLYAMMRVGFTPEINALATLILVFSTFLALLAARALGGRAPVLD